MTDAAWTLERTDRRCLIVRMNPVTGPLDEWEQHFLLRSDAHHDNAMSDHALERRHLDEAKKRGAGILDIGDLFCAMQGTHDRRKSRSALRPEHRDDYYFDRLVSTAADFYEPYAPLWITLSPGNHEQSVAKYQETHLTERLAAEMNHRGGQIHRMPYSHHVIFQGRWGNRERDSISYFGYHGHGGGGPVTKGVIQTNRRATFLPDSRIKHTGHVHEYWILKAMRDRITSRGKVYQESEYHVSTPGYKDEYSPGEGYHNENGRPPKPLGAAWLVLTIRDKKLRMEIREAGE